MKKKGFLLSLLMVVALLVLPVFLLAEEDENLEDMPTTVDETATAENAPAPAMPVIKKDSTYFGVVDIWAAYTTLAMGSVNSLLETTGTTAFTKISGGYTVGIDIGFTFIKDLPLGLGLRFEMIGAGQGIQAGAVTNSTIDASLIPIMAGGSYTFEIPETPLMISADAYAGYSIARAKIVTNGVPGSTTVNYSGSGFALDLGTKVSYQISEPITAGILIGYRIANVASLKADADVADAFVTKGSVLNGTTPGSALPFDFSGLNIGANVDMKY